MIDNPFTSKSGNRAPGGSDLRAAGEAATPGGADARSPRALAGLLCAFLWIATMPAACGPLASTEEAFVVTDSAGVEVVFNRPDESRIAHLHLGDPPLVRLGSEEAGSPELFGQVNSLRVGPERDLWITDLMSAELRVFSLPSGEHRFTVGGRGEGPGEFGMPALIGFDERARAWVWDQQLGRLTVLRANGGIVDIRPADRDREFVPRLLHRTKNDRFIARIARSFPGPVREGMLIQDTLRLWELDALSGEPRLLAERTGPTWYFAEGVQVAIPFAEGSRFGVRDDRIVLTDPWGAPVLDVVEGGAVVRTIHLQRARAPVTREALEANLDGPTRAPPAAALIRDRLADLEIPELLPTWEWIRLGPEGQIFAMRYGTFLTGEIWDVFDAEGRLVGRLTLDEEAHLMDVDQEFLLVLELPELSGPRVAIHPFEEWWQH